MIFAREPSSDLIKLKWSQVEVWEEVLRLNHSSTLDGNTLYIFGGYDGERHCKKKEKIIIKTIKKRWREAPQ